jgi:hypothetical protein
MVVWCRGGRFPAGKASFNAEGVEGSRPPTPSNMDRRFRNDSYRLETVLLVSFAVQMWAPSKAIPYGLTPTA